MRRHILFFSLVLVFSGTLLAQQINYYSCDFENTQVNDKWSLNPGYYGDKISNRWYIGSAVNNGGSNSMYISADGVGDSAYYVASGCAAVAYVELDLQVDDYILSFDWRARGILTGEHALYVAWVPDSEGDVNTSPAGALPQLVIDYALILDKMRNLNYLSLSSTWRNEQLIFHADGEKSKLVFVWLSNETDAADPGACIDNILIMPTDYCEAPTDLEFEEVDETVKLSWTGDEDDNYNIRIYNYLKDSWQDVNVTGTSYVVTDIDEGYSDFYIRRDCGLDNLGNHVYSVPLSITKLIYLINRHCGLDYLTLTKENCYVAENIPSTVFPDSDWENGLVNDGPEANTSRHTVHVDPYEIDEITKYDVGGVGLKTIPVGEFASVRLGNNRNGAQAERAEFRFLVDTMTNPMVILKYAIVVEAPGHDIHEGELIPNSHKDPRFEMKILDSRHRILKDAPECATADFTGSEVKFNPNWQNEGWHFIDSKNTTVVVPSSKDGTGTRNAGDIYWKDWTQVGVNLSAYHGQEVIIQLSSYDCSQNGHFGYSYFVLKCSKGQLEGMECGQVNPVFKAPDGFDYRWYLRSDQQKVHDVTGTWDESLVVSRQQSIDVGTNDTRRYAVDCMFVGDSSCYFTLYASSMIHSPKAGGSYEVIREGCQNKVVFKGDFYMKEEDHITHEVSRTTELCDYIRWDFGDIAESSYNYNPDTVIFPAEGGMFKVKMFAYYQTCSDSDSVWVNIPPIGPVETPLKKKGCRGSSYHAVYRNSDNSVAIDKYYYETGIYEDTVVSSVGCDSIIVLDLEMGDHIDTTVYDTILRGNVYYYDSGYAGVKEVETTNAKTNSTYSGHFELEGGCQKTVTYELYVHDSLSVKIDSVVNVCADAGHVTIPVSFKPGKTDKFSMISSSDFIESIDTTLFPQILSEVDINLSIPDSIRADKYPLLFTFYDLVSDTLHKQVHVNLVVHYPDSILHQKWNDVIAIRDSLNNGGYNFIAFQWYKGDSIIEGATGPYLYLNGAEFDYGQPYYVELTRSDSVVLTTCPVYPVKHTDITQYPSIIGPSVVNSSSRVPLRLPMHATVEIFDTMGRCCLVTSLSQGLSYITAPAEPGLYIVNVLYSSTEVDRKKMIVL